MLEEKTKYRGHTIEIIRDDSPENPRDDENLGTMVYWHSKYTLGDVDGSKEYESPEDCKKQLEEMGAIVLPLYLYDHSGITINTTGFSCAWDSGQVGFIYITEEKIKAEYSDTTDETKNRVREYLMSEVETYDQFIRGEVYGYQVKDAHGEEIEDGSCWGYYGYEHDKSGLLESAQSSIDCEISCNEKQADEFLEQNVDGITSGHFVLS